MLKTVELVRDFPVPTHRLCGLTVDEGLVWFSDAALNEIIAVDSESGRIVRRIACRDVRTGLTMFDGALLQVVGVERSLYKIDLLAGHQSEGFLNPRPGWELCGIEATGAGIWMGYGEPAVLELRRPPSLELIGSIQVHEPPAGVTVTDQYIAYANYAGARINLLEMDTGRTISIPVEGHPTGLGWDGSRLWYCDHANNRLRAIHLPDQQY